MHMHMHMHMHMLTEEAQRPAAQARQTHPGSWLAGLRSTSPHRQAAGPCPARTGSARSQAHHPQHATPGCLASPEASWFQSGLRRPTRAERCVLLTYLGGASLSHWFTPAPEEHRGAHAAGGEGCGLRHKIRCGTGASVNRAQACGGGAEANTCAAFRLRFR